MSLSVTVKSARDLPDVDKLSKSDPFTRVILQGRSKETTVIKDNLNPNWNETLTWEVPGGIAASESIQVEVYDWELIGTSRILGLTEVPLATVIHTGKVTDVVTPLKGRMAEQLNSQITLDLAYEAPRGSGGKTVQRGDSSGSGGRAAKEGGEQESESSDEAEDGVKGGGSDGGGRDGKGLEGQEGGKLHRSGGSGSGKWKTRRQRHGRSGKKISERPIDFQVRVHVLEARRLAGSGLNPVVKIACGKEMQQTNTQRGTNDPYFDEVFFFNFQDHPKQLFDYITELKVCDANRFVSDALIGSFKFDLGLVYDEEDHCYIHKWLLLTDPLDPSSEAKGYLKISIQVLGPGDDPKYSPSPNELAKEEVDIEKNLLRPLGTRLEPATLTVRIIRGEDLPQMDPGYFQKVKSILHIGTVYKDYVDPYCTVSFAGHEEMTQVIWNKQDPEWNKQINLGMRFPSMCERIRFQIMDKDVNADDYIGTFYLRMSQISSLADNNGFLPTFGPCFVNCYGSPREFSILPDKYEHLNKGLIEKGVAYRGRVLVEVEMTLGKLPTSRTEDIKKFDLKKLAPYLRRSSYRLYCAFHSATMVYPYDRPVEFEVSIGNYGNKLDSESPVQVSTTPPCNPTYDGKQYYYLPWMEQKPVVQVDSQWEDCSYRIESLNLILFTAESFRKHLDSAKKMIQVGSYDTVAILGDMLDFFIENLSQRMPELPKEGYTQLDRLTRDQRMKQWDSIRDDCDSLRRSLTTPEQVEPDKIVDMVEDYINQINNMAYEPQNSVPDVIIWMLSGDERVAVKRIPSHELMYSSKSVGKFQGKYCGKLQTLDLIPPAVEKEEEWKELRGRAQVRARLWLGLEKDEKQWKECCQGQPTIFAEIYEYQNWIVKWCASGNIKQDMKDMELPPPGWRWDGGWKIQPERSCTFEPEEGLNEWTEEIFENQTRKFLSHWPDESKSYWTDLYGTLNKNFDRHKMEHPPGWRFTTEWEVDRNRAVDGEGWEYTVKAGMNLEYVPFERNIHHSRRRRWTCVRVRDLDFKAPKETTHEDPEEYGWEYSSLGRHTFHTTKSRFDVIRRRRHIRKLVNEKPGARAVFSKEDDTEVQVVRLDGPSKDEGKKPQVPRMHLEFKESHTYQLRAYLYQARDMYGSDRNGLSDPYAIISLSRYSSRSRVVKADVCPTWDQTIIISNIKIFGDTQPVMECPPPVVLEFFDEDLVGKDEFLGSCSVLPTVCLTQDAPSRRPQLDWYEITRYRNSAGEMLAAFELLLDEGAPLSLGCLQQAPKPPHHYIVPTGIRPELKPMRIEVLCWGVRDMKRFQCLPVSSPLVEVECNGAVVKSEYIKDAKKNPNFPQRILTLDVPLPTNPLYCPPINLRVIDKRTFGRLPLVGLHVVKNLSEYHVDPEITAQQEAITVATEDIDLSTPTRSLTTETPTSSKHTAIDIDGSEAKTEKESSRDDDDDDKSQTETDSSGDDDDDSDYDWWSRYYNSLKEQPKHGKDYTCTGCDSMMIYTGELEKEKDFNGFTDVVQKFALHRGKGARDPEEQAGQPVGYFKGALKVYETSSLTPAPALMFSSVPSTDPVEVIVRVYVIKGINLHPRDPDGKSDPYVKVSIGKKTVSDRDSYIASNLNPTFGKVFELPAKLPFDHTLTISVMDWDRVTADDLIGETKIDLENRFFSKHRATCGLPCSYSKRGPNKWRDQLLPDKILSERMNSKTLQSGNGSSVGNERQSELDKSQHSDRKANLELNKQQLALNVLHKQHLVPEHIETRNLYTPMHPSTSQGQLHMWVDIFKKEEGIPPPVDVSPRKPEKYMLRVVVWNCEILVDVSEQTGEEMNDLYVKGWLRGVDDSAQKTDVHYRSVDGEGNFNWRFVFPFEYIKAENKMVVKKKAHFYSLSKKEVPRRPKLTMEIWDSDPFTPNDLIGNAEFDLSNMNPPMRTTERDQTPSKVNLFKRKWMKGWWPVNNKDINEFEPVAKLELELEIVSEEESELRPAGKARDDPNMNPKLDPPNRPVTSFFWLTSPWKTFRFIIWKNYKWYIILVILVILIIILIILFVYTAPTTIMNWITSRILPG